MFQFSTTLILGYSSIIFKTRIAPGISGAVTALNPERETGKVCIKNRVPGFEKFRWRNSSHKVKRFQTSLVEVEVLDIPHHLPKCTLHEER